MLVEPSDANSRVMRSVTTVTNLNAAGRHVEWIGSTEVLILNTSRGVRVFSGMCPHQGGPLGEGEITDTTVTCPWHGCTFDLDEGQCVDMGTCRNVAGGMRLKPIPFEIRGDQIFVSVTAEEAS